MFFQRFLTTVLLVPIVILGIVYANPRIIQTMALLMVALCAMEWLQLIPCTRWFSRAAFFGALLCLLLIMPTIPYLYAMIAGIVWVLVLFALMSYPRMKNLWGHRWVINLLAFIMLPLFAYSLLKLCTMPHGRIWLLMLLFLVWTADTGAYLVGKLCGKHKLIPAVSPGKTIEGSAGGLLFTLIVGWGCLSYLQTNNLITATKTLPWFTLIFFVFFIALIGDLFLSMLKRRVQIKDSGNLIPGHGGVLDRLDSLIAACPVYYLGIIWLNSGT